MNVFTCCFEKFVFQVKEFLDHWFFASFVKLSPLLALQSNDEGDRVGRRLGEKLLIV